LSKPLLIASANAHKVAEIAQLLAELPWNIKCLSDFPSVDVPPEHGSTFEQNAREKAHYYSACFGVPCVADDSGLAVDALNGAPGVHSARYAGKVSSDAQNTAKLLAAMADVPEGRRRARFICCAVLVRPDGSSHLEEGVVEGRIAAGPRGRSGFGYDPVFIPEGYDRTFAELGPEIKQSISHRARAFAKLREYLESLG